MRQNFPYTHGYDTLQRWISYWYQVQSVIDLNPNTVLEVGPGNGTVSQYLLKRGFQVKTCDVKPAVKPDFVSDVRDIKATNQSFDLVLCCEVLEHIPFADFTKAVSELHRVTRQFAVISLPQRTIYYSVAVRPPFFGLSDLFVRNPLRQRKPPNKYHFWEVDDGAHSLNTIRDVFKRIGFRVLGEKMPVLNTYHRFFMLERNA